MSTSTNVPLLLCERVLQGSIPTALGRAASTACCSQGCWGFAAHVLASPPWAGFLLPVTHSLELRFSHCSPGCGRLLERGCLLISAMMMFFIFSMLAFHVRFFLRKIRLPLLQQQPHNYKNNQMFTNHWSAGAWG